MPGVLGALKEGGLVKEAALSHYQTEGIMSMAAAFFFLQNTVQGWGWVYVMILQWQDGHCWIAAGMTSVYCDLEALASFAELVTLDSNVSFSSVIFTAWFCTCWLWSRPNSVQWGLRSNKCAWDCNTKLHNGFQQAAAACRAVLHTLSLSRHAYMGIRPLNLWINMLGGDVCINTARNDTKVSFPN